MSEALAHSKLGASSMYRWAACPGSVRECEGKSSPSSRYAEEGTLAHDVASRILESKLRNVVDSEMLDHVMTYVEEVALQRLRAGFDTNEQAIKAAALFVEHRFDLSKVFPGCFGTADAVVWNARERKLTVTDLKYGAGIAVEVENNSQLLYYALGALLSLKLPATRVEIVVAQPRCAHKDGPIRRWEIDAVDLLDFRADLIQFAKATQNPEAPLVPGEHCRFCPAAPTCPALHSQATSVAKMVFSPVAEYDPKDLATALEKADIVDAWVHSVRAFAYAEAQRGRMIPGWKMVAKRPTRKWLPLTDAKALQAYYSRFDEEEFLEEPSLKSPAQVEKMLINKEAKSALSQFTTSVSSGNKLVREFEPGEPMKIGPAAAFE